MAGFSRGSIQWLIPLITMLAARLLERNTIFHVAHNF